VNASLSDGEMGAVKTTDPKSVKRLDQVIELVKTDCEGYGTWRKTYG